MQYTMSVYVLCLLSFIINKNDDHLYLHHTHALKSLFAYNKQTLKALNTVIASEIFL